MSKLARPKESPTGAQLEVLQVLSGAEKGALTAAEVWAKLSLEREIARTTVITLLQRLEARGWVSRSGEGRGATYRSTYGTDEATAHIASGFLSRYFDGSASKLVLNLLGEGRLSEEEILTLRRVLEEAEPAREVRNE